MKIFLLIGCVYSMITIMDAVIRKDPRTKLYGSFDSLRESLDGNAIADLISVIIIVVTSMIIIIIWPIAVVMDIVSIVKK